MEMALKNDRLTVCFKKEGGSLTSIKDKDGVEYLWQGDPAYWGNQAPVLFPICGSLRGDQAMIGKGKTARMPRHGLVKKRDFVCKEHSGDRIVFCIESDREMEEDYPYPFRLEIAYTLCEDRIENRFRVVNLGEEEMPFLIGGHPGFNCPLLAGEDYEDYQLVFEQEETCTVPTPVTETGLIDMEHRTPFLKGQRTLALSHDLFSKDAVILDQLRSRSVTLQSKKHGKGVRLDYPQFPYLILWSSANDGPFIALEPWIGLSTCSDEGDVFEEKRNVQRAEPGEAKEYAFTIGIL